MTASEYAAVAALIAVAVVMVAQSAGSALAGAFAAVAGGL